MAGWAGTRNPASYVALWQELSKTLLELLSQEPADNAGYGTLLEVLQQVPWLCAVARRSKYENLSEDVQVATNPSSFPASLGSGARRVLFFSPFFSLCPP